MRDSLCSHYKEVNATDLYQQLLTMSQSQNENLVNFLIHAMDCREMILSACREEIATEPKYSPWVGLSRGLVNGLIRCL